MPRDLFAENNIALEQNGQGRDLFAENNTDFSQEQSRPNTAGERFRALGQGVTLGFGDEITATGKVLGAKALGSKEKFGDLYKIAIEDSRQELENIKKREPARSAILEGGGSLLSAAKILKAGGNAYTGAKTYLGNIGQSAAGGATISAIQGAGDAENLSQIPENIAEKGTEGGAIGAALAATFPVAAKVGSSIYQGAKNILGKNPASNVIEESISPETAQKVLTKLKESKAGQPTTALDVAEPEVDNLVKAISQYPESKMIAAEMAQTRKAGAGSRIKTTLSEDISPIDNAFKNVDDIAKERALLTAPLYEKAYANAENLLTEEGDNVSRIKLKDLINDERIFAAVKTARKDFGISNEVPDVSVQSLHGARQVVDDIISTAKNAGENNKARSYSELRKKINDALYSTSPTLKEADNIFAGKSKLINATQEGMEFNKMPYQELVKQMRNFTQGERDAYRIGARQQMQNAVEKSIKETGKSAPAEAILKNLYSENQIRALFLGDKKKYQDFTKRLGEEISYDQTIKKFGLTKEAVEKDKASAVNFIAKLATNKTELLLDGLRAGERTILSTYKGINKKNAAEIMRTLSNKEKSIKAFENIVKNAEKEQKPLVRAALNDMIPAILASRISAGTENTNAN